MFLLRHDSRVLLIKLFFCCVFLICSRTWSSFITCGRRLQLRLISARIGGVTDRACSGASARPGVRESLKRSPVSIIFPTFFCFRRHHCTQSFRLGWFFGKLITSRLENKNSSILSFVVLEVQNHRLQTLSCLAVKLRYSFRIESQMLMMA